MDSDVNKITFDQNQAVENTDREIWRKVPGDYYSDSIHVTVGDGIGLNVGGHVIVLPIEKWHALAQRGAAPAPEQDAPKMLDDPREKCPKCGLTYKTNVKCHESQ